ncbi:hypothetical protein MPER_12786 [Moniliophthora perniciosa FA553]|nr:hypothetical protein MPER_12786 [Moniliophthora perniciosa FA553]
MPTEYTHDDPAPIENQQNQVKLCTHCHHAVEPGSSVFIVGAEAILCAGCQTQSHLIFPPRSPQALASPLVDIDPRATPPCGEPVSTARDTSRYTPSPFEVADSLEQLPHTYHETVVKYQPALQTLHNAVKPHPIITSALSLPPTRSQPPAQPQRPYLAPSPLTDISRLRGTQKSGRNSYDVTVTIVNWGATEQEDLVHWSRFPAFRHVKHELQKPRLTMCDRDRGAVFMRWKEKFLVPDHRVQDITGASFAENDELNASVMPSSQRLEFPRRRRDSSTRRRGRSASATRVHTTPTATMSGFYFHQNSEPYHYLTYLKVRVPGFEFA